MEEDVMIDSLPQSKNPFCAFRERLRLRYLTMTQWSKNNSFHAFSRWLWLYFLHCSRTNFCTSNGMEISLLQCVREGMSSTTSSSPSPSGSDYKLNNAQIPDEKNRLHSFDTTRICGSLKRYMGRFHITPHRFARERNMAKWIMVIWYFLVQLFYSVMFSVAEK